MKKHCVTYRRLKCMGCGYIATAPKKSSRRTTENHEKTMSCPFCKTTKQFIQLSKWD